MESIDPNVSAINELDNLKNNKRKKDISITKYEWIIFLVLSCYFLMILDILILDMKPWPYTNGTSTSRIMLQESIFFTQISQKCHFIGLTPLGVIALSILPILSAYGVPQLTNNSELALKTKVNQMLRKKKVAHLIRYLLIFGPYLLILFVYWIYIGTDPGNMGDREEYGSQVLRYFLFFGLTSYILHKSSELDPTSLRFVGPFYLIIFVLIFDVITYDVTICYG